MSDGFDFWPSYQSRVGLSFGSALLLLALFAVGCTGSSSATANAKAESLTAETERGPIKLQLELTPRSPALSDQVELKVTVTRSSEFEVEPPQLDGLFEDFLVQNFEEKLPAIDGDKVVATHVYTLEPLAPGPIELEAIPYKFISKDREAPLIVETEPQEVVVTTMVESGEVKLRDLGSAIDPLELPPDPIRYVYWAAGLGVLGLCLVGLVLWRRKPAPPPRELTPAEVARRDLDALRASGIADQDAKEFYVSLTGIVRTFVENTTGVRAPEQTTDEFLREIEERRLFPVHEQERFKGFLEAADLVKYAAQTPTSRDIDAGFEAASRFVERATPLGAFPMVEA